MTEIGSGHRVGPGIPIDAQDEAREQDLPVAGSEASLEPGDSTERVSRERRRRRLGPEHGIEPRSGDGGLLSTLRSFLPRISIDRPDAAPEPPLGPQLSPEASGTGYTNDDFERPARERRTGSTDAYLEQGFNYRQEAWEVLGQATDLARERLGPSFERFEFAVPRVAPDSRYAEGTAFLVVPPEGLSTAETAELFLDAGAQSIGVHVDPDVRAFEDGTGERLYIDANPSPRRQHRAWGDDGRVSSAPAWLAEMIERYWSES